MTPLTAALVLYIVVQLAIGAIASRRIKSEDDYLVAGRRLGPTLTTASLFATWFGAETCIGSAGRAHVEGVSLANAEPFGYGLCLVLMGLVFAVPLWRRKLTTFADLFRTRFSPRVERAAALVLVPSSVLWAAAQVRGFGQVLTVAGGIDPTAAIVAATSLCVLYTVFGGLLADVVTDLVQGIVLVLGMIVLLVAVVRHVGGPAAAVAAFGAAQRAAAASRPPVSLLSTLEIWSVPVLGSVLATEAVSRVVAARSAAVARGSSLAAGALYVVVGLVPVLIAGVAGNLAGPLDDPEQLLPVLSARLLPTAAFAVVAGALVSAILSTVDSTLLVASGLLSHNLVAPALGITDDRAKVRLARAGVAGFGVLAGFLAVRSEGVFALVEDASAFGGAGILVTACFGLFGRVGGPAAALLCLVTSTVAFLALKLGGAPYPFLGSVAVALAAYGAGAVVEGWLGRSVVPEEPPLG